MVTNRSGTRLWGETLEFVYRSVDRTGLFGIRSGRTMVQPNNGNGRGREGEEGRVRLERKHGRRGRNEYQLGDAVGQGGAQVRNALPCERAEPVAFARKQCTQETRVPPVLDLGEGACSFATPSRMHTTAVLNARRVRWPTSSPSPDPHYASSRIQRGRAGAEADGLRCGCWVELDTGGCSGAYALQHLLHCIVWCCKEHNLQFHNHGLEHVCNSLYVLQLPLPGTHSWHGTCMTPASCNG
jgi:hypothetical protein